MSANSEEEQDQSEYLCCKLAAININQKLESEEFKEPFTEKDFKLDTSLTQILNYQAEVVGNILEQLIQHITIADRWYLLISNEPEKLKTFFYDEDIEFMLKTFKICSELDKNTSEPNLDKDIEHCYNMIFNNNKFMDYLTNSSIELQEPIINLIKLIEHVSDIYTQDIRTPYSDVVKQKHMLQDLNERKRIRELRIKNLNIEYAEKQKELDQYSEEKNLQINRITDKIKIQHSSFNEDFNNLIKYTKQNLFILKKNSDQRMCTIEQSVNAVTDKLKKVLNENLKEEKNLRLRKQKLDLELAQWIDKYDKDMAERQKELEIHQEIFEKASKEYEDLSNIMKEHQVIYDQYIIEKTTEEKQIFEEKLYALMATRAAKLIQRAWRANRALQKRKKRKGKKGKSKKSN